MEVITSTDAISGSIQKIVDGAEDRGEVYIVSAFVQMKNDTDEWKNLTTRINFKRDERHVKFIFIVNDEKNKEKIVLDQLKEYADQIWLVPNLHAKFYYNGDDFLISSMNLYLHSAKNNQEIGVEFKKPKSPTDEELEMYEESKRHIEDYISILKREGRNILAKKSKSEDIKLSLIKWGRGYSLKASNNQNLGYCIICGKATSKADYRKGVFVRCKECYEKKPGTKESIKGTRCHICGQEADVHTKSAFCQSCKNQVDKLLEENPTLSS